VYSPSFELASFDGGDRIGGVQALLDALFRINVEWMRGRRFPPLYSSGVRYACGTEKRQKWCDAPEVLRKKRGCCYDLAAYRAAELAVSGVAARPLALFTSETSEVITYHAVVLYPDRRIEDPSEVLSQ
jgi:hypothetical protein